MDDPYAILGVKRDATPADIKKAYRKAAKATHPDLNPGDAGAADRFKRVQAAYELLSDPVKRRRHDRDGPEPSAQQRRRRRAAPPPPYQPAVAAAYSRAVLEAADRMRKLLVEELLPRYVDQHYRGAGAELVWQLLDDIEQYRLLGRLSSPEPSSGARRLARHTAERARVDVRPISVQDRGRPVLGRAMQSVEVVRGQMTFVWRIQLFAGSFFEVGHRQVDQLDMPVLQVLGTELVRILEATIPQEVRPLENRELLLPRPTLAEARAADLTHRLRRLGGVAFVIAVILALLLMIVPGFIM